MGNKPLEQCPNCLSIWAPGSEEWDWQQCDCCGWPDNDDQDEGDPDFDYYGEGDDDDPNDSRNI